MIPSATSGDEAQTTRQLSTSEDLFGQPVRSRSCRASAIQNNVCSRSYSAIDEIRERDFPVIAVLCAFLAEMILFGSQRTPPLWQKFAEALKEMLTI
jgi:hypothetical protein